MRTYELSPGVLRRELSPGELRTNLTSDYNEILSRGLKTILRPREIAMNVTEGFYYEYVDNEYYTYDNFTSPEELPSFLMSKTCFTDVACVPLLVVNVAIFLLGIVGNGVVIWIAGFKIKKTVNTTWYLSLAVSDFIFCAFLPLTIASIATQEWLFGRFMCKFTFFVMFLNMFSSIFLLVIISVDRYVLVIFPVRAQNQHSLREAYVVVVLAWAFAVLLSIPSVLFREITKNSHNITECFNNYISKSSHLNVHLSTFVSAFVLSLFIIIFCYSIIILRLRTSQKSSKPFRVMTAVIVTFFLSWLPYLAFIILEYVNINLISSTGITIAVTLASANSCLNPFLYAVIGRVFMPKCWSSFLDKIKNTFDEEEGDS